jgi:hypothetical protein
VSLIGSLAITGLVSGSAESLLEAVRLAEQGCRFLLGLHGALLGVTASWLIFLW